MICSSKGGLVILNNLRKIREERELTQFELAKLTNIYPSNISEVERGLRIAYPSWKERLAEALGVPEHELFPAVEGANRREA